MSSPGPLLHPYEKLVTIKILDKEFQVPENNSLLRGFQYLAQNGISYGRFCWNEDCQYCRVNYDTGEGTPVRKAISCKLMVEEGMRIVDMATEIRYCLRELNLNATSEPKV